jgi:hypothetical protein
VRAGQPRAGTLAKVECEIKGYESPERPYLIVAVETPCDTKGPTDVNVLIGGRLVSEGKSSEELEKNKTNYVLSRPFQDPGSGAIMTVVISANCVSGERQDGSDQCQMP